MLNQVDSNDRVKLNETDESMAFVLLKHKTTKAALWKIYTCTWKVMIIFSYKDPRIHSIVTEVVYILVHIDMSLTTIISVSTKW